MQLVNTECYKKGVQFKTLTNRVPKHMQIKANKIYNYH